MNQTTVYQPKNPVRVITATALFDGHDASINIMRRILQGTGVEVIHLAHNRSVDEIVKAALEEDVQGIAVSSYQGGHVEFFKYMLDLLKQHGAAHIKLFGGGGGVIVPDEVRELEAYGVSKIYTPEDGTRMGLQGIINHMVELLDFNTLDHGKADISQLSPENSLQVAKMITTIEMANETAATDLDSLRSKLGQIKDQRRVPVIGITGTGGAGKSSLTDEIILRFLMDIKDIRIAIVSSDPSRRKTGGALLGDRIRMNAINNDRIFMRSLATRSSLTEIPDALSDVIQVVQAAGYDLVIAETAGIGQGDSSIVNLSDISLYVMTSEFGAASQLEKIDMLDYADLVAVNKFEKRGGEDAVRDVRKQIQRNRQLWETATEELPVFGTIASKFNDDGVTALYHAIIETIQQKTGLAFETQIPKPASKTSTSKTIIIPSEKTRYLSDIANCVRQ
ncbi:MAG: cobalamin-dependent protein, partial [Deltaproteobacteria bacterium]|nr:cobalamin-dependent protein [Deltaproteobacteria bacterium]